MVSISGGAGHARGQQYLGTMYEFGEGIDRSLTKPSNGIDGRLSKAMPRASKSWRHV